MKNYFFLFILFSILSCNGGGGGGGSKPSIQDGNNTDTSNDPLTQYAWHLKNNGQSTFSSSQGESGYDLRMDKTFAAGIYGEGISILVSDSGVEGTHEDLKDNFSTRNFDYKKPWPFLSAKALPSNREDKYGDPHGTNVAGIIAGSMNNNLGSRGVAPRANISSANYLASDVANSTEIDLNQVENDFDIINQSWGIPQCNLEPENEAYSEQVTFSGKNFRDGKGSVIVKSAGNDYGLNLLESCKRSDINRVGNANFDPGNNTPEITVVGAYNAVGYASSYSSPGSNIWISAPGGEYGLDFQSDGPAIITTDRVGCEFGHSGLWFYIMSPYGFANSFDGFVDGEDFFVHNLNLECNYTSSMNGTSSAAPMVSGAVALMLEANPNLTLRDVKHILASTAYELKHKSSYESNPFSNSPSGHQWEQGWITNKAGFKFHNRYGFGAIHIDDAVSMAKSDYQNLPEQLRTIDEDDDWIYTSGSLSMPIPDNSATGMSHQIFVSHNFNIEAVQIRINAIHANLGDLGIELTSPGGTKSILSNVNNSLDGLQNFTNNLFLTNAFYGESSAGPWTIKLIDGKSGSTGTLTNWKINIIGNLKDVNPGPVVNLSNESTYSSLTQSPIVSWDASLTGNVSSYEYALGSSLGLRDIREWTSVGLNRSFTASGLNLANSQVVYVSVRAVSSGGSYSLSRSTSWTVDTSGPGISLSPPSMALTRNANVTFTVTYSGATSISLSANDITLNKTGTANGVVTVSGSGLTSRTVTVSSISGNGTIGISIASGTALKTGFSAPAANSTSFTVDNLGPVITIGSPSSLITKNSNVLFTVSYDGASSITLNSSHITLNKTGTANGTIAVSGTGSSSRTVTISGITGNGTLSISIAANTAVDSLENTALSSGPSTAFTVDNTGPSISISSPSQNVTASASVSYTVTYTDASLITLSTSNVTLNKTGTANGTVSVSGSGTSTRTVTISGITGNGTLGISIASGTATDSIGNLSLSAGPSTTFVVDNLGPNVNLGSPSSAVVSTADVTFLISYTDAVSVSLNSSHITLNKTGTANGTVSVSGSGTSTRTVTISGISGNGTLGISVASGTATDTLGNFASSAGPSTTFVVDNSGPVLTISAPSKTVASSSVSFTVTSNESATFNFSAEDVVLSGTGTANGTVSVSGSGTSTRTITISNLIGDGTLAISLPADIAQDTIGNRNNATNLSQSFKLGCETGSQTFNFTGSSEQFTVPDRCSSIVVTIQGGAGGSGTKTTGQTPTPGVGGVGGKIKGTISTSPGIIFNIFVAKQGGTCGNINSYYHCGGGGGGASAIVRASNNTPMLIAGGGSGGTSIKPTGTNRNGVSGENSTVVSTSLDPSGGGDPVYGLIEGGWGYRNGGKGAETYWGEIAYGGGGAGASKTVVGSSSAGSSSNTNGGAGESYYNPNFVSDYTYMAPQAGNGQVQISWGE